MPEQSPDAGHDLVSALVADDVERDVPPDATSVRFAAVESGPISDRLKQKGIGVGGWLAVIWMVVIAIVAIAGPYFPGVLDPKADVSDLRLGIMTHGPVVDADGNTSDVLHILGTDGSGQDVFSLVIHGARASMTIGVLSILFGFFVGGIFGLLSGYFKGKVGAVLGSTTDILLAFPPLILALSIVTFLGNSVFWVTFALAIVSTPLLARIARASTLSWAEREFVTAARAQGAKHGRVMKRELLPNVIPAMLSIALLGIAVVIVAEAGLAIVGAGVSSNTITWGNIIEAGRADIKDAPHIVLAPSIVIFITVLALNYLGDVFRAKFDVRESAL